jgi:hypothetical protein
MARKTQEWRGKTDDTMPPPRVRQRSKCSVEECEGLVTGLKLCNRHYRRMRRHGDPRAGATSHGAVDAFLEGAITSSFDTCIEWPFGKNNGYGSIRESRYGTKYAHIYVCERAHGKSPSTGMYACHAPIICNNSSCINPRHLRWDTPKANQLDSVLDGTKNIGERCGTAKLTEQEVRQIRSVNAPDSVVSKLFGISEGSVSDIRTRKTWRHI